MSIPEMKTAQEMMEYFNGRTIASMHVVALLVAKRQEPAEFILAMTQGFIQRVKSESDGTPAGKAYAEGFASILPLIQEALRAANDVDMLISLDGQKEH